MWYFNYIRHLIILLQFSHALVCSEKVVDDVGDGGLLQTRPAGKLCPRQHVLSGQDAEDGEAVALLNIQAVFSDLSHGAHSLPFPDIPELF